MPEYHDTGWKIKRPSVDEEYLVRLVVPDGMSLPPTIELAFDIRSSTRGVWTPIELMDGDATIAPVRT
jgi:hypothetical protein